MFGMVEILEDESVNNYIYNQLKQIKKNNVSATSILINLGNLISKDHNCTFTSDGMVIKIDRKKDFVEVKAKIISMLTSLVPLEIDIKFLFKILSHGCELVLRIKRNI